MKDIVVTGGNAGIGFETVRELARRGHRVTFTSRNMEKGQTALDRIRNEYPEADVSVVQVDLTDFESIREACSEILEISPRIDVLIHNAGTFQSIRRENEAGIELSLMVNHVAPFYMTHLLLPALKQSGDGRIICVNSDSHFFGSFDPDNINLQRRYQGLRAYCRTKLANVYFTYEFDRRNPYPHLKIFAVHPGLVNTDIGAKDATFLHRLVWNWRSRSGKTPREGAETSIYLATAEGNELESGKYWDNCRVKKSSKLSYNEQNAALLWEKTAGLCGLEGKEFFQEAGRNP